MINLTLLKKEIKSNYKILFIFIGVLTLYSSMIISMFDPKLGESLKQMAESMPGLFSAFKMSDPGSTMIEFISNYLYGFLFVAFPMIFSIILSNRLITRYIDKGSMSYILSTPNRRGKIIATWIFTMILMVLILIVYVTVLSIVLSQVMFEGELDIGKFLIMNIGLFGLQAFIVALCFMFSCIFSDSKYALGASAAFNVGFLLIQMLSQAGDKFEKLKYLTPLTLFDTSGIVAGDESSYICMGVLYLLAAVMFIVGALVFSKKDLSV